MTESVIKQMSNNSGSGYCQMPDGTLICWGSTNISVSANSRTAKSVGTETFISNPIATATIRNYGIGSDGSTKIAINVPGVTTTNITILVGNAGSTSTSLDVDYIAIGRWK